MLRCRREKWLSVPLPLALCLPLSLSPLSVTRDPSPLQHHSPFLPQITSPFLLSPGRGVHTCNCPGSPSRRVNNLPFCVLGVPQIFASPRLCLGCLWYTCVLSQLGHLSFKTPNFRDLLWLGSMLVPGGWSHCTETNAVLSKKGSRTKVRGTEFGVKHGEEPMFKLPTLSRRLCTYAERRGRVMAPPALWSLERPLLPVTLQEGSSGSSSAFQGILRLCHLLPGYLLSFSTGAQQCSLGSTPVMPQTSKTSIFESHWL